MSDSRIELCFAARVMLPPLPLGEVEPQARERVKRMSVSHRKLKQRTPSRPLPRPTSPAARERLSISDVNQHVNSPSELAGCFFMRHASELNTLNTKFEVEFFVAGSFQPRAKCRYFLPFLSRSRLRQQYQLAMLA